ncbi:MAG TPA: hypothetical protein VF186_02410 [Gaiellaceae bacterium]|jgi:hypothetical protein
MKRLALIALLAALAVPSTSPAAGCSPLDCAASGVALPGGLLAARLAGVNGRVRVVDLRSGAQRRVLPPGVLAGGTLVREDQADLQWIDPASGRVVAHRTIQEGLLVGASQDGRRAVLQWSAARKAVFGIAGRGGAVHEAIVGRGNWGFDALSGQSLYLLHYLKRGYEVRRFDLAANRLVAQPLKDPNGSSLIWGVAWARLASPGGRYLFTLYVGPDGGSMIHELDLRSGTARCISLPGDGDFDAASSYALALSPDGRTLWAVSPGYGRVVGVDVAAARVRGAFRFPLSVDRFGGTSVAAIAPGGRRIAVAAGDRLWLVDLRSHGVREVRQAAGALGFDPDGSRLWVVGAHGRVSTLAPVTTSAGTRVR